jgi:hypothetical protein
LCAIGGPVITLVGFAIDIAKDGEATIPALGTIVIVAIALHVARFLWRRSFRRDAVLEATPVEEWDWEDDKVFAEILGIVWMGSICFTVVYAALH